MSNNEEKPEPVKVPLVFPVPYTLTEPVPGPNPGDPVVPTVFVHRPKARHLATMDRKKGQITQSIQVVAAVCGLTYQQAEELEIEDLIAIQEIISPFLPNSGASAAPETPET